eukprot:gene20232-26983_t
MEDQSVNPQAAMVPGNSTFLGEVIMRMEDQSVNPLAAIEPGNLSFSGKALVGIAMKAVTDLVPDCGRPWAWAHAWDDGKLCIVQLSIRRRRQTQAATPQDWPKTVKMSTDVTWLAELDENSQNIYSLVGSDLGALRTFDEDQGSSILVSSEVRKQVLHRN